MDPGVVLVENPSAPPWATVSLLSLPALLSRRSSAASFIPLCVIGDCAILIKVCCKRWERVQW